MARITWAGVPKDGTARKAVRKEIRENLKEAHVSEFLVCSDRAADQKARTRVRVSLWAFRPEFIGRHTKGRPLDKRATDALGEPQEKLCEDSNELIFSMLSSFKSFWREAVAADGRGHFLSSWDGNEHEVRVNGVSYFIYRN